MSAPTWAELALLYANAAIRAEVKYREHVETFNAIKAGYEASIKGARSAVAMTNAASKASGDPTREAEGKAAAWYRDEAVMYASLAQMAAARS